MALVREGTGASCLQKGPSQLRSSDLESLRGSPFPRLLNLGSNSTRWYVVNLHQLLDFQYLSRDFRAMPVVYGLHPFVDTERNECGFELVTKRNS